MAREWITVEVSRRLLQHLLDGYGQDPAATALVDTASCMRRAMEHLLR